MYYSSVYNKSYAQNVLYLTYMHEHVNLNYYENEVLYK